MPLYISEKELKKQIAQEERGKQLARISQIKDDEKRKNGKILKVFEFPAENQYDRVPAIRVAGLWLYRFGFNIGDKIVLSVKNGEINIKKLEKSF